MDIQDKLELTELKARYKANHLEPEYNNRLIDLLIKFNDDLEDQLNDLDNSQDVEINEPIDRNDLD